MHTTGAARTLSKKSERRVSNQSLLALDWLNFLKADVQTTLGPYLAIFLLAVRHWDTGKIGIAISAPGIVAIIAQTPMGALVDSTARKRTLVIASAVALGIGALLLIAADSLVIVTLGQTAIAVASTVIPPAIASISLGLVGRRWFARRMGRNEAYSHGGAFTAAICAALIAYWFSQAAIFVFAAAMSVAAALVTLAIRARDIDPLLAREGAADHEGNFAAAAFRDLLRNTRVRTLLVAVVLFHLANGAMLPLVGEIFSAHHPDTAQTYMSACILISQIVMLPIAVVAGRLADTWGRKPTLLVGFAILPIRGVLFTAVRNPYALVSIQLLDGVSAGIFGVVGVVMIADLARRTGRFNLMQGALNTCVAIGASLSNLVAGFVTRQAGFRAGFMVLTALAVGALLFFWAVMPETKRRIGRSTVWPNLIGVGKRLASQMAG